MASTVAQEAMTTILAGPSGLGSRPISIPRAALAAASPVFRAMLDGPFQEAEKTTIRFPDDSWENWHFLSFWLSHRSFPGGDGRQYRGTYATEDAYRKTLARAWMFADKYLISAYQLEISTLFSRLIGFSGLDCEHAAAIYELTREGCPLRELICREIVRMCAPERRFGRWEDFAALNRYDSYAADLQKSLDDFHAEIARRHEEDILRALDNDEY